MKPSIKALLVLLALLLPACLLGLGERPVYKIQEVRIAETARELPVDDVAAEVAWRSRPIPKPEPKAAEGQEEAVKHART